MRSPWTSAGCYLILTTLLSLLCVPFKSAATETANRDVEPTFDPSLYQALEYRLIGPSRGGRAPAVTGVPQQPFTFYMGTSGGGVWKTDDAGTTWRNISDGFFEASSIGAVAVAPSDPNIIYVGTGESCLRGDVQTGLGVYKSMDGGKTWVHVGLRSSGQIGRIRIHPKNPELVYVAVLGHAFGPNEERGVFRSRDGGASWEKILYVSDKAGAVDLAMDIHNPLVLFATIYEVVRKPWILVSGGEDSGLYKSSDGGETWTELKEGLPTGLKGRIGVSLTPANSERVYVNMEADDGGGVYRSDDGGETFERVSKDRKLVTRAFYFTHIVADPVDENTVYVMNIRFYRSVDAGKTYEEIRTRHGDYHDLWVNPQNPRVMIIGDDGGGTVSLNGGRSWSEQMNQPTAEFYRVATDNQFPYRVYGCQQDNSSISVPSRVDRRRVVPDLYPVGGGEQGHIAVHPEDPNIVYAGEYEGQITRYDHRTGAIRLIETYPQLAEGLPAEALKYRFQMNAPIRISPHDPGILYHTSQYVHRSQNEGQSWEIISPDLTTNDKSKQGPSGGPITKDHTGPETYTTIFAFEESPRTRGLLWVGTDDGLVHLSRNAGLDWANITPQGMPPGATVNMIELSPHDPARALIAVHRYRLDDFTPYIFRTNDYGHTWKLLTNGKNGVPGHHFVRVVREDPFKKGILYAGTEFGMYVSFNDGETWQTLQLNLPVAQVADMVIKDKDLVVATHGRSFWILDDITPFHQLTEEVAAARAHLFSSKEAYRRTGFTGFYTLAEVPKEPVELAFLKSDGTVIRAFTSGAEGDDRIEVKSGMNRFDWDLRYPAANVVEDALWFGRNEGPLSVPGKYQVRLTVGDWSQTRSFEVRKAPGVPTTQEEFQKQFDLGIRIRDRITELSDAIRKLRSVREQVNNLSSTSAKAGWDDVELAAEKLAGSLASVEDGLMQTKNEDPLDTCNYPPRLDSQFIRLLNVTLSSEHGPIDGCYVRFEDLNPRLERYLADLEAILTGELGKFNDLVRSKTVSPVIVPPRP